MNINTNYQKSLQSREPQANVRKGWNPNSQAHFNTKVKVGSKVVGQINGDTFEKKLYSSTHFLRKPRAIAFDVESLTQVRTLGAKRVKIYDLDTGLVYSVTIELILEKGFRFNRGFGDQIGLTLNHWQCTGKLETNAIKDPMVNTYRKHDASQKSNSLDRDVQPYLFNNKR